MVLLSFKKGGLRGDSLGLNRLYCHFIVCSTLYCCCFLPYREPNMAPNRQRCNRTEINIVNNAELRANAQNVLTFIRESRPKNTSLAYTPKQKEFKVRRQHS